MSGLLDPWAWRSDMNAPQPGPMPEARSYTPAWHDRVVNSITNGIFGPNANAQQREGVNHIFGPDNPFNIPAQINQGYNTAKLGVDLGDPAQAGIGVAQMAMSLPFGIGKAPAQAATQAATKGIKAYHGSPHDFDRFSLDKIGTGEGAQAYGHGLYFAENEGVAKAYRDQLQKHKFNVGNEPFNDSNPLHYAAQVLAQKGSKEEAIKALAPRKSMWSDRVIDDPLSMEARRIIESVENIPPYAVVPNGRMYEVNIKADPNDFLDWDKPLSQQSEKVRAGLNKMWGGGLDETAPGMRYAPQMPEMVEKAKGLGIPGIKYLDQGSRTAGEGSRNYVVFDDSLIEILRKYGLAGILAGGAAATAQPSTAEAKGVLQ